VNDKETLEAGLRRAHASYRLGNFAAAGDACFQILRQQPDNFLALHLLGVLSLQTGQTLKGVELLAKAVALDPNYAPAHGNLGNGLRDLKRFDEALESYDRAIALQPDFAEAWGNRGNALVALRRSREAVDSYDKAIALKPAFAEAHSNRARALLELDRPEDALAACDRAIALNPAMASPWGNRGTALNKLKRHDEAADAYRNLLAINPHYPFMKGMLLYQKMYVCDWNRIGNLIAEISGDIMAGKLAADPFGWQGVATSPESLQRCAEQFSRKRFPAEIAPAPRHHHHEKIRIGYVSGEFREHATALLMAGVLECHNKKDFEIFAFDNGWDDQSQTRQRIEAAVHRIVPIRDVSDSRAAALVRDYEIDILVNLNGYFGGDRTLLFAQRPAPLQVSYLGFPGTLGADYIDYIIADSHVIPENEREFYTEKIVWLPDSYQANDREKIIAPRLFSRAECGLPEHGFVFCCFNNNYKILPGLFDAWLRILARTQGSVLWLLEDNVTAAANLKKEAAARGVAPGRLVFAKRLPLAEHLARHRCADLFLDTLPYNAHTTASDALWAGLPVLTCLGTTFPGRVGASLLHAVGLSELITASLPDYEQLAVGLASNPGRLAGIKQKLADNRLTMPLFDTGRFTRNIEAAFSAIYARCRAGGAPDHIVVSGI
jgi:predicted O-linked N-acetylglucosamine transferase (SPINDLY family)